MSARSKLHVFAAVLILCGAVLPARLAGQTQADPTNGAPSPRQHKAKTSPKKVEKPQPPPLPSGPTGPVQQVPLDSMAPVAPQVSYQNQQLTIDAPNSTLGDILRAVRKQTGAEIEVPSAPERVVTHLGPGPARDVIADLLNGSRFNYVLLGSPADNNVLTRVVLVPKSAADAASENNPAIAEQEQPGVVRHTGNPGARLPEPDANATEANDDSADDAAAAAAEQPPPQPEPEPPAASSEQQQMVKTPQQMLQEMQQRQLQFQQQQQQQQQGQQPPPRPPQQ
jgi:hypothetical protein